MNGYERHQMLTALILLATTLFVAGAYPSAARWRRQLRIATLVAFCAAAGWAFFEIAVWLTTGAR